MKKYYAIITLAGLVLCSLFGCKKTLEEKPRTFLDPDGFFNNPESYESAVKGIYDGVPDLLGGNIQMMREMFSDIYAAPSASYEQALPTYRNAHEPFFYNTRQLWANCYSIIKNANFIIDKLGTAGIPDAAKTPLIAEAKCLRAYAYFNLVQFYGGVPMRIKPIQNYNELQAPRGTEEEAYKQIVEDLTAAEAGLKEEAPQKGRVYKKVATALLAKVYLTMAGNPLNKTAYYVNARDKALEVIGDNKFQLVDDYAKVFQTTTYTTETIWGVLYVPGIGGNPIHGQTCTAPGFVTLLLPAPWFMNSFPKGDRRRSWGIRTTYKDPSGATLAPFFAKFIDTTFIDNGISPSGSGIVSMAVPLIRLSEMYLIAAEAENEINGPAAAYAYINKVRARARENKNDATQVPDLSGLTKPQFRDAVILERKWELHLEGSTWMDMKRTNTFSKIQTVRGNNLIHAIGAYNQTWLIPDVEITNNSIAQNPAY
ncbi:RagB/SusD family nutrient uptake outer membrane protein [Chitinophaga defluvii]|uniref:RagB/SusD family nutrient uptake outer membrane protein n=1 Tax=Chitinophaga defluvii TaxID=3163343 RepID=A0ABV2T5U1_9BACT